MTQSKPSSSARTAQRALYSNVQEVPRGAVDGDQAAVEPAGERSFVFGHGVPADRAQCVDGRVEGDVTCAALMQGESSEIVGAITADTARLHGRVRGTVTAGALIIGKSARIEGDVCYDTLTIEQGALVEGRLSQRNQEPRLLTQG